MEENSLDLKPTAIRKSLNSSERFQAKKEIRNTLNSRISSVEELRWELEAKQSIECHQNEIFGPHLYMRTMLALLDVGEFYLYKCTCIDLYSLSDEEILQMGGL